MEIWNEMNPDLTQCCFMCLTKRVKSDYPNRRKDLYWWIQERKNVLGIASGIKKILCFLSDLNLSDGGDKERRRWKRALRENERGWNSGEVVWLLYRSFWRGVWFVRKGEVSEQIRGGERRGTLTLGDSKGRKETQTSGRRWGRGSRITKTRMFRKVTTRFYQIIVIV